LDAAGGRNAERDRRVEVTARYGPERIGTRDDRETERKSHADEADAETGSVAARTEVGGEERGADAAEHQQERAEELGDQRGCCRGHRFSSCVSCHGLTFLERSIRLKLAGRARRAPEGEREIFSS